MPAIAGAASAAGSIVGGALGGKGAKKAAKAQLKATRETNALQEKIYNQNTQNLSPFMERGNTAGVAVNSLLGLGGDPAAQQKAFDVWRDNTGYQFGQDQGAKAVNSMYAGRGLLESGAAQKALVKFGQDYGDSKFGDYFDRVNGQQGFGLTAASALAGVGTNFGNQVGQNNQNAAAARGNSALIGANSWGQGIAGAGNALGQTLGSSYGGGQTAAQIGFNDYGQTGLPSSSFNPWS